MLIKKASLEATKEKAIVEDAIVSKEDPTPIEKEIKTNPAGLVQCKTNGIELPITYSKNGRLITEKFTEPDFVLYLPRELAEKMDKLSGPIEMV